VSCGGALAVAYSVGRTLIRMSARMQPPEAVRQLFDLCEARTGLTEQFRRIRVPDL
jgi:hypothetical protein